jgi:hypothetical protein
LSFIHNQALTSEGSKGFFAAFPFVVPAAFFVTGAAVARGGVEVEEIGSAAAASMLVSPSAAAPFTALLGILFDQLSEV